MATRHSEKFDDLISSGRKAKTRYIAYRAWPLRLCRFGLLFCHCGFGLAFGSTALASRLWLFRFGFVVSVSKLRLRGFSVAVSTIRLSSARLWHRSFDFIASPLLLRPRCFRFATHATFGFTASGSLITLSLWFLLRDFAFQASALQRGFGFSNSAWRAFGDAGSFCHCCCRCWRELCWCSAL